VAISKAAWRAFESTSEPRTRSQWVWLGRSTPMWWEPSWSGNILEPPDTPSPVPFPSDPAPLASFVDHAYLAQHDGDSFDTLAWKALFTVEGFDFDLRILQWQEASWFRSLVMLARGTSARCWLGSVQASQRDARLDQIRHKSYGLAALAGGSWTITPGFLANGFNLACVQPSWSQHAGILDMTAGPQPTSMVLTWILP